MKKLLIGLLAAFCVIAGFGQPTPVQVVEATAAQVAAGTAGAPYYVSPRRLAGGGGSGVFSSLTDSSLTTGRVVYAGTGGLLQDSANLTFTNGTTTGQLIVPVGAVGTPGITFTGDTDNGLYYVTTNHIGLAIGGAVNTRWVGTHTLLGGLTTDGTGVLQFPAATTNAGGIAFGTDVFVFRSGNNTLQFILNTGIFGNGSGTPAFIVNGGSGTGQGGYASFGKAGTYTTYIGVDSGVRGTGTDSGLTLYANSGNAVYLYSNGVLGLTLDSSQRAILAGAYVGSTSTLSGAGAANVTTETTKLTTAGTGDAITLADGVNGQIKRLVLDVLTSGGHTSVLTPTTKTGFSTVTFTGAGQTVTLLFVTTRGWMVVGSYGVTIAP